MFSSKRESSVLRPADAVSNVTLFCFRCCVIREPTCALPSAAAGYKLKNWTSCRSLILRAVKVATKQCGLQFVFTAGEFLDTRNQRYHKEGHEDVL